MLLIAEALAYIGPLVSVSDDEWNESLTLILTGVFYAARLLPSE